MDDLLLESLTQHIALKYALPRIYKVSPGRTLLLGAPKSGKSTLAMDFAKDFPKAIYLNLADPRLLGQNLNALLLKLYLEKSAFCLVIDNAHADNFRIFNALSLPNIPHIVVVASHAPSEIPAGFYVKKILPLTFGEFVGFSSKNHSIEQLFSAFLTDGNAADAHVFGHLAQEQKTALAIERIERIFGEFVGIFRALLDFFGAPLSVRNLYARLKKMGVKCSKDTLYPLVASWENRGIIFLVSEFNTHKKRLFLGDFSLLNHFKFEKKFNKTLENVLFLELESRRLSGSIAQIFYHPNGGFVVLESSGGELDSAHDSTDSVHASLFLFLPFVNKESVEIALSKYDGFKRAIILTLNYQGSGTTSGIAYTAMEFSAFALGEV